MNHPYDPDGKLSDEEYLEKVDAVQNASYDAYLQKMRRARIRNLFFFAIFLLIVFYIIFAR
jgi:hypothetical protein